MDSSHQQILPYNPEWVHLYQEEAEQLRPVFGESLLGIEHIGSTSVPGLASKPIIDIAVQIADSKDADKFILPLQELGYSFDTEAHSKSEFPERHFFRKGIPSKYHLSIAYTDRGSFWKRQLAFRDYLRTHPEECDRYAALKENLIKEDPSGKDAYIKGKTDLINEMLDKSGFVRWKKPSQA